MEALREITGAVKERSMSGQKAVPCSSCNGKKEESVPF
jgi:hypothetical protein